MVSSISPEALQALFDGQEPFALIDVREAGEFNSTHIPGASFLPRRQLEFQLASAVPFLGTHVVVCDDDGRRAALAAATIESVGYGQVSVLAGGTNRWASEDRRTEWGMNVPSKDFGEKMEVVHHVPEIEATELRERIDRGDKLVILDTRTPEEYHRFCIPGGQSMPGGEIALRITDVQKQLDPDTTVIVNCAGRTRSIIGTRMLQRMGIENVYGLKNGTSGWLLAGYQLETGANRLDLPEPSSEGVAAAEAYAARLAEEDQVRSLDVPALQALMARRERESVYCIDVRMENEYIRGHIPGFRWFPGGQAVQRSDDLAVVKHCPIVFCCDGKARATFTASWYRQMGLEEVYVVDGGTAAWQQSGLALERGLVEPEPLGFREARNAVRVVTPQAVQDFTHHRAAVVIFVETSQDFAQGHVPGSYWVPRGSLELQIAQVVPTPETPVVVTCTDGRNAVFAGATLQGLGYQQISVLDGGMAAWQAAGLPVEHGLTNVMSAPGDVIVSGPDRNYADMMNYLRWETDLGDKYAS